MPKSKPQALQSISGALISFLSAVALSGCGHGAKPEIIHATKDEISIGVASAWSRPDAIASQHCRRFDKEAVYLSTVRVDEYSDTRIVYYSCQWPNFG